MTEYSVGFQPHLWCPHCGKHQMAEVTGYARYGLNSRNKVCKHCEKEFVVSILVQTSVGGLEFQDMYDRMHTEKLKRIKKMQVGEEQEIKCPHSPVCSGILVRQGNGLWKCSRCESRFAAQTRM